MSSAYPSTWSPPRYIIKSGFWRVVLYLSILIYLFFAIGTLDLNWQRIYEGLDRGWRFLQGFLQPDFTSRAKDIGDGLMESLTMTATATILGVVLSIPIGIGAAENISPRILYWLCRSFIAISRSIQEIIIAIFLVALFGFGPFAGFLTLTFATIGFMAKLLAEEIESVNKSQIEAIKSTGASWMQMLNYSIQPQVMPRLIGLSMYRLDINFRESAIIGIVGAGGIGATLTTAIERYEYDSAGAILILIILIVMACEYSSGYVRRWVS